MRRITGNLLTHEYSMERNTGVEGADEGSNTLPSAECFGKIWSLSLPPMWSILRGPLLRSSSDVHLFLNVALSAVRSLPLKSSNSRLESSTLRTSFIVLRTSWTVTLAPRGSLEASTWMACGYPWQFSSFSDSMGGYTAEEVSSSFGRS